MRKKLQTKLLLILVPPLVACVLLLGPLRGTTAAAETTTPTPANATLALPQAPSLWQVGSALAGVLLIGVVGVMVIARLKGVRPMARTGEAGEILTLRQSLRISGRHHVHAIEFDGRVILLGECDNNVSLLTTTEDPQATVDERDIRLREEEAGVDLRDTPRAPRKRLAKKATAKKTGAPKTKKKRAPKVDLPTPTEDAAPTDASAANLADFKSLLRRARQKASV